MNQLVYISEAFISDSFGYTEERIETPNGMRTQLILEGEFQRANTPNRNNRVYSEALLVRETKKLASFIKDRNGLPMEMDHPLPGDDPASLTLAQRVSMSNACALCTTLEMHNGAVVYGKSVVLDGDFGAGDKLAAMVRKGFKPGVSSRGIGGKPIYQPNGTIMIPEDYNMLTWDYVTQPSVHNSILQKYNEEIIFNLKNEWEQQYNSRNKFYEVLVDLRKKHTK